MTRIDDVLELENLDPEARKELEAGKQEVKDLRALSQVSQSEGGGVLLEMLKEDCGELLLAMLKAQEATDKEKVFALVSDFKAKFTLFNTIRNAELDYTEAEEALQERVAEIIEK